MRGLMLFVAGLGCGLAMQTALAQGENAGVAINHVGIAVQSIPDAATWYRDKMGFKEAFRNSDQQGNVTDVNGLRIELAELGPESLQRKASEAWK